MATPLRITYDRIRLSWNHGDGNSAFNLFVNLLTVISFVLYYGFSRRLAIF